MSNILRSLIELNRRASASFERTVLSKHRTDGISKYTSDFVPPNLRRGIVVYDVGGGSTPVLSLEDKRGLGITYVGIDASEKELESAPDGVYDKVHCCDIALFRGNEDADLIICRGVLEHVRDVSGAFEGMASILKPGGRAVLFLPCRNALYARFALLIGENLKRRLLFSIHPSTREHQGFPSYYDACTPSQFRSLAKPLGLTVEQQEEYTFSFYTSFLLPLHICYRLTTLFLYKTFGSDFCESFSMVLRKESQ